MSQVNLHMRAPDVLALPLPEAIRRAVFELESVRAGMERAFDTIHHHVSPEAGLAPDYLVAMQSIDALSQQVAAVERFIVNVTRRFGDEMTIDPAAAAAGITLAAVAARLTTNAGTQHDSDECDFF